MVKGIQHTGIFALGVGTFVYLYHKNYHGHLLHAVEMQELSKTYCPADMKHPKRGKAAVPKDIAQEGPLVLKLKQVQVIFRHGARIPLHQVPKLDEANYEHQFLMREHQASLFPYDRILRCTGKKVDWSHYERKQLTMPIKSGVPFGALTAYGKDQMYLLGKTLQLCYRDSLNLATYDPNEVFVLSSNIRRTVESARCTLAGFFGKEQLKAFAELCLPLKIFVTDNDYNILIPDIDNCDVLKKMNYRSMINPDSIPGFKDDRLAIEDKINKEREKNMDSVKKIQEKMNLLSECFKLDESSKGKTLELNEYQQPYLRDPILHPLIENRSKAIDKTDRLWADAMVRNNCLSQVITDTDMRALIYLRRLEVERFDGMSRSGYRFHFELEVKLCPRLEKHFDPNPYFYNEHLCKEVYLNSPHCAPPSWSIPIVWKECANLLTDIDASGNMVCHSAIKNSNNTASTCGPKKVSFFHWYTQPTCEQSDSIGKAIRDEVWTDPIKSLEGKRKHLDKWDSNFNFVAARDDSVSREVHGLAVPKVLKDFEKVINTNAAKMLYYSMNGQTSSERCILARLSAGPLLTYMVNVIDDAIQEKECVPKLCLYSTHDSIVCGFMEAMGIWNNEWPPFASDIRFELYKDVKSSEHYVRILYCGKVQRVQSQQADYLHWHDFKKSISKFLVKEDEYRSLCCSDIFERNTKNMCNDKNAQCPSAGK